MTASFITTYGLQNYLEDKTERGCSEELGSLHQGRLGIESEAHSRLRKGLQSDVSRLYPKIDLSFLSMQNIELGVAHEYTTATVYAEKTDIPILGYVKNWIVGIPKFSIFSLESPIFQITLAASCTISDGRRFPYDRMQDRLIRKHYAKIQAKITDKPPRPKKIIFFPGYDGRTRLTLEDRFLGFVPAITKKKIEDACYIFGDRIPLADETNKNIYIIKEATSWQKTVPTGDPLVIGILNDQAYLIDQFDTTPIERYAVREFSEEEQT